MAEPVDTQRNGSGFSAPQHAYKEAAERRSRICTGREIKERVVPKVQIRGIANRDEILSRRRRPPPLEKAVQ
jgi:hypothetical protein